jgi:Ca2+-binding RTX toxin-like protein
MIDASSIEMETQMAVVYGTNGNDYIVPDYLNGPWYYSDTVYLYDGDDYVDTSSGDDYIEAGAGSDTVDAGDGDDQIFGGIGNDTLNGDLGNDVIYGGDGDDIINGGLQDDFLYGDAGNDVFLHTGLDGWDHYSGGTGTDTIYIQNVSSSATFGQIKISSLDSIEAIVNGDSTKDVDILVDGSIDFSGTGLTNIRDIVGSSGDDSITASTGADVVKGRDGDDFIDGWSGNDTLEGGNGNDDLFGNAGYDTLTGGAGADRFFFVQDGAVDTVTDFEDGTDLLVFAGATSLSLFDYGGHAAFELNGDTYVILEGIDVAQIDSSDYAFI